MAKYQVRINFIPNGCEGEGDFWWFDDQTLPQVEGATPYYINPKHWSTTAFELVPYLVLPKITNKDKWDVSYHSDSDDMVMARYTNKDGDIAIIELCDKNGFISCRWEEEDRLPKGPAFTVFPGNGKQIACDTPHEAALSIVNAIMDHHNRRGYICARK